MTLRHPRRVLGAAIIAIAALGILGLGVESRLTPTSLSVPGAPAAKGEALLRAHFGDLAPFAVLLRGPAPAIERQGPALIRSLREDPKVTTLSPWDRRTLARLRPSPREALILVDFHTSTAEAVDDVVPHLNETLERVIHAPVRANQTGLASLSRAIQEESISSTERAELIALPFLLLVLLFVFRSPVAALIPLGFGAITVIASRGVLYLAAGAIEIDAFSLTVATMMGLALGVDYALLIVSRFREELATGADPVQAARATRQTAGRTTLFAGSTLFVSMIVCVFVLPGSLLLSLAGTAILVTALSVVVAIYLVPALLVLLGPNIDRWRIGAPTNGEHTLLHRGLSAALRRPAPIAITIGAVLLLLAAPALAIKTGPPSAAQLPPSDPARRDSELIARQIGAGWNAPYVVVAATGAGPITTKADLRHLARFQSLLARQPGVRAVIGAGQIAKRTAPLQKRGEELMGPGGERQVAELRTLGPKLAAAGSGVGRLRTGLSRAAAGAGLLGEGSNRARDGAEQLASGLERAAGGGDRAVRAIDRLADGAGRLAEGQETAKAGALSLALGLHDLLPQLRKGSLARARKIRARLSAAAPTDPALKPAAAEVSALVAALAGQRDELRSLRATAMRLHDGSARLAAGQGKLASGTDRLAAAAGTLGSGLHRLAGGAGALAGGLARLTDGTEHLASGLSDGYARSAPLQGGLVRAGARVTAQGGEIAQQRAALVHASPHLFDSGYFVLSALDGAKPGVREQAAQTVDLDGSGQGAAILVVPDSDFNTPASETLDGRLNHLAAAFGSKADLETGVTGGPAQLTDYNQVTRTRVPLVILAMTLVTFLALVAILRALILAALTVVLNLMTVGVAFGVLALLFRVPAGYPLGGHDYVDAIGAAGIFGIVFGLSVDYAVFLLARMRESYEASGDHQEAVSFGLQKTARVITGAAAIMMAVFLCFAAADISTVSQLGVGLAVAVALDATVVRILLLPALMLLIGERVWWLPKPLARLLPRIELHPA
ncbi:MAG TPA: efflux RND transporter permease subunit [Solirubrobacterales bacterium]|nr:efflux RND transporter permease subunit [Solirubrobacterales bacterium]